MPFFAIGKTWETFKIFGKTASLNDWLMIDNINEEVRFFMSSNIKVANKLSKLTILVFVKTFLLLFQKEKAKILLSQQFRSHYKEEVPSLSRHQPQ